MFFTKEQKNIQTHHDTKKEKKKIKEDYNKTSIEI
jgi:hypothetical protein